MGSRVTGLWPVGEAMTVTGPVPSSALGLTSMHEHVLCDVSSYRILEADAVADNSGLDLSFSLEHRGFLVEQGFFFSTANCRLDDAPDMTNELAEFKATGGETVLELSCPGLRTDVEGLRGIAVAAGVPIVASTGLYIEPSWPAELAAMDEPALEAFMVAEIEEGIGDTGIQAGHIGELGVTDLGPRQASVLRAAARAAVRTGVAVTVHPGWDPTSDGRRILTLLTEEGLPPDRIVLAHGDAFFTEHTGRRLISEPHCREAQIDYHTELLEAGANISIDCFGHNWNIAASDWVMESETDRFTGLLALVEAGFAAQLLLGTDTCFKMLTRRGGGLGYRHLTETVIPRLRTMGLDDKDINTMTTLSPARLLGRVRS
jgi:phosphotriesterase-related protein